MKQTIEEIRAQWAETDAIRDKGLSVPAGLEIYRDIPYSGDMLLDVYCPEGTAESLPTVISIHGGGWFYGDKELYSHYCMRLALRGFTVVNFNYRLAPEHKYPAALEDCVQVLHWIQNHGANYHIDTDKLFIVGDSAGGQLAFQVITMLTSPAYAALFDFACPKGLQIRGCGMNCGCYFLPFGPLFPPKAMGQLFAAYFPEDYMAVLPQLKTQKYVTADFPPAFVMTFQNDYLKFMAPMLHRLLQKKGVPSILRIYGHKKDKAVGHVHHLNCYSDLARTCNDEQCQFFRNQL